VKKRIERILDETRPIPQGLTRGRWVALLACGVPLVWLASVAQLERAAAQDPPSPPAMFEMLRSGRQLGPAEVASMEQFLAANPNDTAVRAELILYYYAHNVRQPRLDHIFWMIANHPENNQIAMLSQGVLPRTSSLNDASDYQKVLGLWRQAAATHADNPLVLGNAAQFLQGVGEYDEAERLLLQAKTLQPNSMNWNQRLGTLYAAAILGATGDPKFPHQNPAFANRVKTQLENSEDRWLVSAAASSLMQVARRPQAGRPLPPGMLNLDDHPMLVSAVDFGAQLMQRTTEMGLPVPPGANVIVGGVPGGVRGGTIGGVIQGVPGGVSGGVAGPTVRENLMPTTPAPPVVRKVDPTYPPLARQARISGVVRLMVTIQADGSVNHIQVENGHPLLVPAAIEAVKQWAFQAPGKEVTSLIEVPFNIGDVAPVGSLPPDAPRKSAATPSMIRVGSNVQSAKLVQHVDPVYPQTARAEGVEGNVTLQITIGQDGSVESAFPTEGNPLLAQAAVDAVKRWKYQPTLLNDAPVKVQTTVTVPFELK
jgi:TonB family protein